MMDTSVFLLREIQPSQDLYDVLSKLDQLWEFQDGTIWWNDQQATEPEYAHEIISTTKAFGLFSDPNAPNLHARYSTLERAQKALASAKPVIKTELDIEDEENGQIIGAED
jgi:hypothetical protein